ncbi:alpha/beta hydrolase [Veronia pacifica]|uniref:Alpha/beta hydrolase n=1 Tax=Veronia pacifica TaxID=1080227 RepID=A0A1C3EL54_9GAMM|nr:hypothetical protein [Veronia pacifica]ODA33950.1 hypothetical protein A8L45_07820 [Veronia pacifica]
MSNSTLQSNPLFTSRINYPIELDGHCEKDIVYGTDPSLVMDIYYPKALKSRVSLVIFVTGYPDPGFQQMTGMKLKEVQQYISWAQLFAASGIAALTYSNVDPKKDIFTLLKFLGKNASALGIDPDKISIWSCSGNVPNALSVLAEDTSIKCAALLYGFMVDSCDSQAVKEASKTFRFVNPLSGQRFPKLPSTLVVRAGMDEMPGLNSSIDAFISQCLRHNTPVTLLNLPNARHAFDVIGHWAGTEQTIRSILAFFQRHLIR